MVIPSKDEVRELTEAFEKMRCSLRQDTQLHQAIWEASPLPKWILDRETLRFVDVNRAAVALYGYSREEFLQMTLKDVRAPEDAATLSAALASLPRGDEQRCTVWQHRKKDATHLDVEIRSNCLSIDGRSVVCSTVSDLTAVRRAEVELAASEERYRTLFQASSTPMWLWDAANYRFLAVNGAMTRLYGYTSEELMGATLDVLMREGDRAAFRERRRSAGNAQVVGERVHVTKAGKELRVEIVAQHFEFDGRPCVLTVARDVTERRSLEAQLLQAQKMEAVGLLAGGVAHDFNNILAVILAGAEWMAAELDPAHPLQSEAASIGAAAQRAAALTRQLLAFSRGHAHQPKVIQLNALVSDAEKLLRRLLGEDIRLTCELDPLLGVVEADPSQMEQVLLNLAVNARDAMPEGGSLALTSANVELAEPREGLTAGRYVAVSVADSGSGMDADTLARIFEPFFTTKAPGKGTGLGLSTVFGIIKQSGGAITVDSKPGHGTKFTMVLPRLEQASALSTHPAPVGSASGRGRTVLVVEDDEPVRHVVCRALRARGYGVIEARHVAEATVVIDDPARTVDLVLSDIVMPGGDGITFAAHVHALRADVPVLLMSGYSDKVAQLEGTQRLLPKPFTPDQLGAAVREALGAA